MAQLTQQSVTDFIALTGMDGSGRHAPFTVWEEAQLLNWWIKSRALLAKIDMLACYASEENTDAQEQVLIEIGKIARLES